MLSSWLIFIYLQIFNILMGTSPKMVAMAGIVLDFSCFGKSSQHVESDKNLGWDYDNGN